MYAESYTNLLYTAFSLNFCSILAGAPLPHFLDEETKAHRVMFPSYKEVEQDFPVLKTTFPATTTPSFNASVIMLLRMYVGITFNIVFHILVSCSVHQRGQLLSHTLFLMSNTYPT